MRSIRSFVLLAILGACPGSHAAARADFERSAFPEPVFDREPGFVDLYWKACELAHDHILTQPGLPQARYMDEAFAEDTIWIWDTSFMVLYCRYAPDALPGIESLLNFYAPIHDGVEMKAEASGIRVKIRHPDNPPLFAWAEWQYFQLTGDQQRVKWLLREKQYLQKHYRWFAALHRGQEFPWAQVGAGLRPGPLGYQWSGWASGMDNSPRFAHDVFAIDALAQQGLAARCIWQLAESIGDASLADEYQREFVRIRTLVNQRYWDAQDGFYYDLMPDGRTFSRVRTPASFWPVLAGMATADQVKAMASYVRSPREFGGPRPWASLSRSDPGFATTQGGDYWRGAIWLPTAYVGIHALLENGQAELADTTAEALLRHMYATFRDYEPHTIWECYNPDRPEPALHGGNRVRPGFCGWSALGPVSLLIENVLGFHRVDASRRLVEWQIHQAGRHGIRRLRFADVVTDIVADGRGAFEVTSNGTYTLVVNGTTLAVKSGTARYSLP